MSHFDQAKALKEIVTEFKALTPEERRDRLGKVAFSDWAQIFDALEAEGLKVASAPLDHNLEKVFDELSKLTPEQLHEKLAKYKNDPLAHTLQFLNDPEGYAATTTTDQPHSTEENHHGQVQDPPASNASP